MGNHHGKNGDSDPSNADDYGELAGGLIGVMPHNAFEAKESHRRLAAFKDQRAKYKRKKAAYDRDQKRFHLEQRQFESGEGPEPTPVTLHKPHRPAAAFDGPTDNELPCLDKTKGTCLASKTCYWDSKHEICYGPSQEQIEGAAQFKKDEERRSREAKQTKVQDSKRAKAEALDAKRAAATAAAAARADLVKQKGASPRRRKKDTGDATAPSGPPYDRVVHAMKKIQHVLEKSQSSDDGKALVAKIKTAVHNLADVESILQDAQVSLNQPEEARLFFESF
jgi:hypothetical protein